jgi:hypothetical protein
VKYDQKRRVDLLLSKKTVLGRDLQLFSGQARIGDRLLRKNIFPI